MSFAVGVSAQSLETPAHHKRNARWRRGVGVCLLYAVAAVCFTWPLAGKLHTHAAAHFDPPFSAWRLAWVARQLGHAPGDLFDGNIFWPAKRTLAYSDAMLVQGVLGLPLIRSGVSPLAVMNGFTLLGLVTSAAAAYLLARRLSGHTGAAILAGAVFAFAPYRHDHLHHLELQWAQWMPLAFWAWHRTLDRGTFRDGLLCGVFVLLQLLSSIYYGIFLATTLGVVALTMLALRRFRLAPAAIAGLAVGAVLLGVVTAEYAKPYRQVQREVGDRDTIETRRYSAELVNFLSTRHDNLLYGSLTSGWGGEEKRLFPGLTPLVLTGAAFAPPVAATAAVYGVGALFAADAARGLNGVVFSVLRAYVPGFAAFRAPARFGVVVQLMLGVLAALGLARLAQRWPRHGAWMVGASLALVAIEYSVRPVPLMAMPVDPPRVYRWLAATQPRGSVVLEYPVPYDRLPDEDPMYMYASIWHWLPLVNGYSGHYYPPYLRLLESMATFPDAASLAHMERAGVEILIVHKVLVPKYSYERLIARIEASPKFRLLTVADDWVTEARVYAFVPRYGKALAVTSDK